MNSAECLATGVLRLRLKRLLNFIRERVGSMGAESELSLSTLYTWVVSSVFMFKDAVMLRCFTLSRK